MAIHSGGEGNAGILQPGSVIPAALKRLRNPASPASPMLATAGRMHKHLRRLQRVWIDRPIYFITTCTLKDERFWRQKKLRQY